MEAHSDRSAGSARNSKQRPTSPDKGRIHALPAEARRRWTRFLDVLEPALAAAGTAVEATDVRPVREACSTPKTRRTTADAASTSIGSRPLALNSAASLVGTQMRT